MSTFTQALTEAEAEQFDDHLLNGKHPYDDASSDDPEREAAFLRGVRQAIADIDFEADLVGEGQRLEAKYRANLYFSQHGELTAAIQHEVDFARGYHHAETWIDEAWYDTCAHAKFEATESLMQQTRLAWQRWSKDLQPFEIPLFCKLEAEKVRKAAKVSEDDNLCSIPGFVNDVMDLTLESAPYPSRPLAFCGALSLLSVLAARKVTFQGLMPNLYILALASSGSGKDAPRKVNIELLTQCGYDTSLSDAFSSGEGLEDAMHITSAMLSQWDEFDSVIDAIANAREGRHTSIAAMLLKLFTSAPTYYFLRRKAGDEAPRRIHLPSLTLFATCTPRGFYDAMSEKLLANGLVARMLVVEAGPRGAGQRPKAIEPSESILAQVAHWRDLATHSGNLESIHPKPIEAAISNEAADMLDQYRIDCDALYDKQDSEGGKAIVARSYEQASKLALLYACSANPLDLTISIEAVGWSTRFVQEQVARLLEAAATRVHDNDFDRLCGKLMGRIRQAPDGIEHGVLLRYSKVDSKTFRNAIVTLYESGQISDKLSPTSTKPTRIYAAI